MSSEKKNKSINEAIRAIHKQFGSGSIMRLDGSQSARRSTVDDDLHALQGADGDGFHTHGYGLLGLGESDFVAGRCIADFQFDERPIGGERATGSIRGRDRRHAKLAAAM